MLKRENRLKISSKKSNQKVFSSPLFTIKVSDGVGATKFGFVVSKKISKSAVVRNKTKRVLRDAAKEVLNKVGLGKNILIISKKELSFEKKDEVVSSLLDLLAKAK